ncbi:hypothetical protein ZOSMA_5G01460 [Zostera marina]|uniref:Uncharacterized protein n=1 Tax=Zostera marina TaxID=29655 RepID=A0A0K9NWD6_ZOSMR|nr:hypothetical protein ZOSMA_5G01460 [Zostera marina]
MSPSTTSSFSLIRSSNFSPPSRIPSTTSRLHPPPSSSSFSYNVRIDLALVPCVLFLLDLGGTSVISVLTIGLMVSYILDSLGLKPAAFISIWFSLITAQIAFFFASSASSLSIPVTVLVSFFCGYVNFLVGVWASLQFKWMQIENPSIVSALERFLFACVPIAVPAMFTWATVSAVGMQNAGYYYMVFCCVFYWLFSIPPPSSFQSKQEPTDQILGPLESCFHMLHLLFVPLMFHVGSHHSVIFSSSESICDLLLFFYHL